jgi:hypothetical protein
MMKRLCVIASASAVVSFAAGCPNVECVRTNDCSVGFDCTLDGVCVSTPQGEIRWLSPEPGSVVAGETFDAVVEVSFRAPAATITFDRDVVDHGDVCAPFIPTTVTVLGDLQEAIVQQVTVPGLFALGDEFGVSATLNAAGGTRSTRVTFRGEPTGYEGADIELRLTEDTINLVDASTTLGVTLSATFERAAARALLSVEPLGAAPTPRQLLGGGIAALDEVRAPVARGPQIVWLDTEDDGGDSHRCGVGLSGGNEGAAGVELGLSFEGADPGQLDLLVLLADGETTCSFNEPGDACEALYETRMPTRAGEEVLLVKQNSGLLRVAVVPGAASASLTARVRVSSNGAHVGWLGPFPLQPAQGEHWIAGSIVLDGSLATIVPELIEPTGVGPPF